MKLIIGNQKTYLNSDEMNDFITKLDGDYRHVIICPSAIYFERFQNKKILLGSQNVSKYKNGATTGEVSCEQLKSLNISFSIVGHSERREMQSETIQDTNLKIKRLLECNMIPILCVGETKLEKEIGKEEEILIDELDGAVMNLTPTEMEKIIVAYEPIWAIGTGLVPTNQEIERAIGLIKDFFKDKGCHSNIVLYGGSVSSKNIDELNQVSNVDGYLIGGASTKIDEFITIIDKCKAN